MTDLAHRPPPRPAARTGPVWVSAAVLAGATLLAYHNSFSTPFVFDDVPAIVENPAVRHPASLADALGLGQHGGLTVSGRPVVSLSFALNYALGGAGVAGFHLVNFLVHVAAGLCLFGLVRRTVARLGGPALPVALGVAALWLLHPLQTESVTYIVQRAESLVGLFYLLTLYAFVRATDGAARPSRWLAASVAACALGMAAKEVMVSAPLLVLLYDRAFVSGTLRAAWARRRGYYLALAATWALLAALVLGTGNRGGTAGLDTGVSSWSYALTQCEAIVRYLRLALWPAPLVFDYGTGTVRSLADVFFQACAVVALVAAAGLALVRWPKVGFLGAWFFAVLAPSSSFVPVITQTVAEHRMYLPLVVPLAGLVWIAQAALGARAWWAGGAAALALVLATTARNRDYRSDLVLWRDTALKHPANARAHNNLGQALYRAGRLPEAMVSYEEALRLQPKYPETQYNLGVALAALGRLPEAVARYEAALRTEPDYPEAHNNLANALVRLGRLDEAVRHYEAALARRPEFAEAHNNLGNALLQRDQPQAAAEQFRRALALRRDDAEARYNLGNAQAALGAMDAALAEYREAMRLRPGYAEAMVNAGNALAALQRPAEARQQYEQALAADPQLADAHLNLGMLLLQAERWDEAIPRFEAVLRLRPGAAPAHRALGFALAQAGRRAEALPHYEAYLQAVPDDAEARAELAQLRGLAR